MTINRINPVVQQLTQYASEKMFAAAMGNYKEYKTASKAFAKLASDNLELLPQVKAPKMQGVPLFSKIGRCIMKILFLEKFRIKTPEEKMVKKYIKELRQKEETTKYMRLG